MPKINYSRLRQKRWKTRIPIGKPTKVIIPDSMYNRKRVRDKLRRKLKDYEGIVNENDLK